jgi:hypothetical protein
MVQEYAAWGFFFGFFIGAGMVAGLLRLQAWHDKEAEIRRMEAEWRWHNRGWNDQN